MEENQNIRKLLLRRVAVATGAGLLAVVAGLGTAPAGAAEGIDKITFELANFDLDADIDTRGADDLSAGAEAGVEAQASDVAVWEALVIVSVDKP